MARLIRMDQTGHTTLAEWTAGDAAAAEAAVAAFREQLDAGYYAVVSTGEGHAEQVRELPRRRRARDPAAADRRRVSTAPVLPETAAVYWRPRLDAARLRRRGQRVDAQHARPHDPVPRRRGAADGARAALVPGRGGRRSCTRGGSRRCTPTAARCVVRPRPRAGDGPERDRARPARRPARPRRARAARPHRARAGARRARRLARRGGGRAARAPRRPPRRLLVREGRTASCPSADRTAHLLLALREDEAGFATVANLAFSGAAWRVRRRLPRADAPGAGRRARGRLTPPGCRNPAARSLDPPVHVRAGPRRRSCLP